MTALASPSERLWFGPYGRVVAGIFSLAFLVAFESLAVMTVMPVVADELDGLSLYALAFAAPTAVAVVSMTIAGPLMDRRGTGLALRTGVGIFAAGLLVASIAPTMEVFLVGRAVQGLGMGFVGVGLYVVIGKVFPEHMRPRVFTVMTSAWVLPALIGPVIAGFIADHVGWRWVFLSVPLVAIGSLLLIWAALSSLEGNPDVVSDRRRLWWASLAAGRNPRGQRRRATYVRLVAGPVDRCARDHRGVRSAAPAEGHVDRPSGFAERHRDPKLVGAGGSQIPAAGPLSARREPWLERVACGAGAHERRRPLVQRVVGRRERSGPGVEAAARAPWRGLRAARHPPQAS